MLRKKVLSFGLITCLLLGNATTSYAGDKNILQEHVKPVLISEHIQDNINISVKEIKSETDELVVNAQIPQIQGLKDKDLQTQINTLIMNQAMQAKEKIEEEAKQFKKDAEKHGWNVRPFVLTITYSLKSKNDILSFTVTTYPYTGGTGMPGVDYYNIALKENKIISLQDLFINNIDYKSLINKKIKEQIKQQTELGDKVYFNGDMGFSSISDKQDFYIQNGYLVIGFAKYEIAPGFMGIPEFKIPLDDFKEYLNHDYKYLCNSLPENKIKLSLEKNNFYAKDDEVMIPLRLVAEKLDYKVVWNNVNQSVNLIKEDNQLTLKIGDEDCFTGKNTPVHLSTAPEIKEGITYVPLNSLANILNFKVLKEEQEKITIIKDNERQIQSDNTGM